MKNPSVASIKTTVPTFAVHPSQLGSGKALERGRISRDRPRASKHAVGMINVICCRTTALETMALKASRRSLSQFHSSCEESERRVDTKNKIARRGGAAPSWEPRYKVPIKKMSIKFANSAAV
jgi:hypothetical protein